MLFLGPLMPAQRRAVLALIALTLIWGYSWIVAKLALHYVAPFAFAAQRATIAAIALFLALLIMRRPLRPSLPRQTAINGLVQTGAFLALQTWALVEGGPGKTSVLIFTAPIWTLLMARPFLGERILANQWLAAAITLAGLILIIEPWQLQTTLLSKLIGLLAALSWAASTVMVKRLRARHDIDTMSFNAWQMAFGALFLSLVAMLAQEPATRWDGSYIALLIFLGIVSTAFGWFLWLYVLDRLPAWEASLSVLGVPAVANLAARWQLGETVSGIELSGMLLIGAGLALLSLFNWRQQRAG